MSPQFTLPTAVPDDAFFDDMPPELREILESGFSQLVTLPPESLKNIVSQAIRWFDPTEPAPEVGTLARESKVDAPTMKAIMVAVTFQASQLFAARHSMPLHAFVTKAINTGVLKKDYAQTVEAFGNEYLEPRSAAIRDALARANSSVRIVPSFQSLDTTIDLRIADVNDERVVTMPVVIATLQTDVSDRELLFQMTPRDVGQLLRKLEAVTKQLTRLKGMTTQPTSEE